MNLEDQCQHVCTTLCQEKKNTSVRLRRQACACTAGCREPGRSSSHDEHKRTPLARFGKPSSSNLQSRSPMEPGTTTTWLWKQAKKERSSERADRRRRSQQKEAGRWFGRHQSDRPAALLHSSRARWLHRSLASSGRRDREPSPFWWSARSIVLISSLGSAALKAAAQESRRSHPWTPPACDDAKERHG